MAARYLAVLDCGSTILKLALFHRDTESDVQQLCANWAAPRLLFDENASLLLEQARHWMNERGSKAHLDVAVIGHIPETDVLGKVSWKITHEDAMQAVVKRLSSTSTAVAVDIGSQRTMIALGKFGKVSVQTFEYGVGLEAWNIVRQPTGLDSVKAWIPLGIDDATIENYLANKSLFAELIPSTNEELMIEQAVARTILREVIGSLAIPWQEVNLLVVSGSVLTQTPIPAQTVSMVLDGLMPVGTMQLIADPNLIVMACGGAFESWSPKDYRIGRSMLHKNLRPVGTLVGLDTPMQGHRNLAKVTLDLGLDHNQVLEVKSGDILQLPLPADDQGRLEVAGTHGQAVKQAAEQQAVGGDAGLIIDGRGRPLLLSENENERRAKLLQWDKQLNAHGQYGTIGAPA
jgi:hypothetical protein